MKFSNKKTDKGEIIFYEPVGEEWGGITAKSFSEELINLGPVKEIDLRIDSDGGNVFQGVTIYNRLKAHQAKINVFIDGAAASIASVIAMAGDHITVADNAFMFVHNPWGAVRGYADDLRKTADQMDEVKKSIMSAYMHKVDITESQVSDLMDNETWLNSSQLKEFGFVDEITGGLAIAAHCDYSKFPNAPAELIGKYDTNASVKQTLAKMSNTLRKRKLGV